MVPFSGEVKFWQECGMASFISSHENLQHPPIACEAYQHQRYVLCSLVGYAKSWEVCSQLGQSEGFHDLGMRQELMAFALTHCPPSAIEALLGVSSSLQTQVGVSLTFMLVQFVPK